MADDARQRGAKLVADHRHEVGAKALETLLLGEPPERVLALERGGEGAAHVDDPDPGQQGQEHEDNR